MMWLVRPPQCVERKSGKVNAVGVEEGLEDAASPDDRGNMSSLQQPLTVTITSLPNNVSLVPPNRTTSITPHQIWKSFLWMSTVNIAPAVFYPAQKEATWPVSNATRLSMPATFHKKVHSLELIHVLHKNRPLSLSPLLHHHHTLSPLL